MPKVKVTIKLVMEIPDSWKLVKHADDMIVLDMGDSRFLDMTFSPIIATHMNSGAEWSNEFDEELSQSVLGMVSECDTKMRRLQ